MTADTTLDLSIPNDTSTVDTTIKYLPDDMVRSPTSQHLIVKLDESLMSKFTKLSAERGISTQTLSAELLEGLSQVIEDEKNQDLVEIKRIKTSRIIATQLENIDQTNLKHRIIDIKVLGTPLCADALNEFLHPDYRSDHNLKLGKEFSSNDGNVISTLFHESALSLSSRFNSLFHTTHQSNLVLETDLSTPTAFVLNPGFADRKIELLDNGNLRLQTGRVNINPASSLINDASPVMTPEIVEFDPTSVGSKIIEQDGRLNLLVIHKLITDTAEIAAKKAAEDTLNNVKRPWLNLDLKVLSYEFKIDGTKIHLTFKNCANFLLAASKPIVKGITGICLAVGLLYGSCNLGHIYNDQIPTGKMAVDAVVAKVRDVPFEIGLSLDGLSFKFNSTKEDTKAPAVIEAKPVSVQAVEKEPSVKISESEALLKNEFYHTMATWDIKDSKSVNSLKYITIAVDNIQAMHKLTGQPVFIDDEDLRQAHLRLDQLTKPAKVMPYVITPY